MPNCLLDGKYCDGSGIGGVLVLIMFVYWW